MVQAIGFGIANNTKSNYPFAFDTVYLILGATAELVHAVINQIKLDELIKLQMEIFATLKKLLTKPITSSSFNKPWVQLTST
jgi:hypothetical protein